MQYISISIIHCYLIWTIHQVQHPLYAYRYQTTNLNKSWLRRPSKQRTFSAKVPLAGEHLFVKLRDAKWLYSECRIVATKTAHACNTNHDQTNATSRKRASNQGANLTVNCSCENDSRLAMNNLFKQTSCLQFANFSRITHYVSWNAPSRTEVGTASMFLLTSSLQSYTHLNANQNLTVFVNWKWRKQQRYRYEWTPCMSSIPV
jgi:hypothetical protein